MTLCAYCRVSTDSKDQNNSYENQCSYFEREIKVKGYTLYKIYADKGLSGTKLNNRPEFFQMLYDAGVDVKNIRTVRGDTRTKTKHTVYELSDRKPLFDEIWIKNTSRFARNTLSYEIITLLRSKGVNIFFLEQNINSNDIAQDLLLKLMQIFDEQDSKDKSLKVRTGNYESAQQGNVRTHPRIYGYSYDIVNKTLTVIDKEACVVRMIFELYASNYGIRRIQDHLNKNGVLTRDGKPFGRTSIRRILDNEKYAGLNNPLKYDGGSVFSGRTSSVIKDQYIVKRSERIPQIITEALFYKCKNILNENVNHKLSKGVYNGVTRYCGLLYCKKCGQKYISNKDNGRRFYNCKGKKSTPKTCDAPNINEEKLNEYFTSVLEKHKDIIRSSATLITKKVLLNVKKSIESMDMSMYDKTNHIDIEINNLKIKLDRIYDLYIEAHINKDALKEKMSMIEKQISIKELELQEASKSNNEIVDNIYERMKSLENISNTIKNYTAPTSIEDLLDTIEKIYISGKRGDICISFIFKGMRDIDIDDMIEEADVDYQKIVQDAQRILKEHNRGNVP